MIHTQKRQKEFFCQRRLHWTGIEESLAICGWNCGLLSPSSVLRGSHTVSMATSDIGTRWFGLLSSDLQRAPWQRKPLFVWEISSVEPPKTSPWLLYQHTDLLPVDIGGDVVIPGSFSALTGSKIWLAWDSSSPTCTSSQECCTNIHVAS